MKKTTVKIINPVQAGFYYKNGLKPLEIVFTDRWVWVFDKESSNGVQGVQTRLKRKDRFESK